MSIKFEDKPLEVCREAVTDQLIMNYGHGRLSLEAFQRRLDQAVEACDHSALTALVVDLELSVDSSYREQKQREFVPEINARESGVVDYMLAIFGGSNRSGNWDVAREIRIVTIFGGCDIDFSEARFCQPLVKIKLLCLFGGVKIVVPRGVAATSSVLCLFGGLDNAIQTSLEGNVAKLEVQGLVLFGGASIKLKKVLRERFVEFADGLKSLFGSGQK